MTHAERQAALDAIAREVRACTRCRLHQTRTNAVPGEGHASTEVMFVGEGPGFNEDRQGRPFVGRAGDKLVDLLRSIEWPRDEVFITNVVKCRPPNNRDPFPDEIAACRPFLQRQLEVLDPALVVTLGRFSMAAFLPGARISQAHGTVRPVDPATGARDASAYAMYHPAAALRSTEVDRQSREDALRIPAALQASRARRAAHAATATDAGTALAEVQAVAVAPSVPAPVDLPLSPPAEPAAGSDTAPAQPEAAAAEPQAAAAQPGAAGQSGMFQL
jgi:uracil-DNA glycosylase family 4